MVLKLHPVELAEKLIRCKSVTPAEGGALDYLQSQLTTLGFQCWRLPFSAPNTPDVDNLFARWGTELPHLGFAGHTDVVPAGDEAAWTHPPFAAETANGVLYGRGTSDMKGAIAAFLAAVSQHIGTKKINGSISFLITGDEEGPSINGTEKLLHWMKANNHVPTDCIVGEPTNPQQIGEMIKIGRRGYANGFITIKGKAGHSAYAHLANNPIPGLAAVVTALSQLKLDQGTDFFEPSTLAMTAVDVGTSANANNVIPEMARARFNIRFNDRHSRQSILKQITSLIETTLAGTGLTFEFTMSRGGEAFITAPGPELEKFEKAIHAVTGKMPERSTTGGTSDARFIRSYCPVFEFGLVNATIHQTDEHVKIADLEQLTAIYSQFIRDYFG